MRYLTDRLKFDTPPTNAYCYGHKVHTLGLTFCFGGKHQVQALRFHDDGFVTRLLSLDQARLWVSQRRVSPLLSTNCPTAVALETLLGVPLIADDSLADNFELQPDDEVLRLEIDSTQPLPESGVELAALLAANPERCKWFLHSLSRKG
jgi:hypothetical protein